MAAERDKLGREFENWLRLVVLVDYAGRQLCHYVVFHREKLPTDASKLCVELKHLVSKRHYQEDQREILCPSNGKTDPKKFDLTLWTSIIQDKFGDKYKSFREDLRKARNHLFHVGNKELSYQEFKQLWECNIHMLDYYGFNAKLVGDLETCNLFQHQWMKDLGISSSAAGNITLTLGIISWQFVVLIYSINFTSKFSHDQ